MGYASYGTPMGMAGYGVEDICNEESCAVEIDRGLAFLCGTAPGQADEHGCGRWFCGDHLYMAPEGIEGYLCNVCLLRADEERGEAAADG